MWKDVKNYEGFYQVNENGNVKRLASFRKNGGSGYIQKEKVLKNTMRSKNDYYCVNLSKYGKSKIHSIHRLVAEAFIPNEENKPQVNHINGIKTDNNIKNLEWVTARENIIHCDKFLGRNRNKEGLKLGSIAATKTDLNITNGEKTFQTYKEIKSYLENKLNKEINLKSVQQGIKCCCCGVYKTAFNMKWWYIK